jgi:hypothetical protein
VEVLSQRQVGHEFAHLQLFLANGAEGQRGNGAGEGSIARNPQSPVTRNHSRKAFPAIAFRQGAWADGLPKTIDIIYTINVNKWQGNSNLQLVIEDIRPA